MTAAPSPPAWSVVETPFGPLTLGGGPQGLATVHFAGRAPGLDEAARNDAPFAAAAAQLEAYFAGDRRTFDVTLDLTGSAFQRRVWAALRAIPYGATTSYGRLAARIGHEDGTAPPDARAVGWAIARTPTPIVVPCHRVLGADGSLTGYLGGLHRKRALLDLEASGGDPAALRDGWGQRQLALL